MNPVRTKQLIDVAREATKAATDLLAKEYRAIRSGTKSLKVSTKSSAIDLVTDLDIKAQNVIIKTIQTHFPDHRFLAEEEGADALGDPDSPYQWIIDPLDRTLNFIHGKAGFGSIVAVQKDGELLAGAMHLPLLDQWYWGGRGEGAFANGSKVKLRNTRDLKDAILCCNVIHRAEELNGALRVTVPPCGSVENYGCAAEELGEILMGHTDGVFFEGIRLWDIAAGFLLLEEAGGTMRLEPLEPGNPRGGYRAAASTAPIFDELWEWVATKMKS